VGEPDAPPGVVMSDTATRVHVAATRLVAAWRGAAPVPSAALDLRGADDATAVQGAIWHALDDAGTVPGGWKVGAPGPDVEATCAPLPHCCLAACGATISGAGVRRRGVELELALRVGRPVDAATAADPRALALCFDEAYSAIEVVESRLEDWETAPALAKLADLQSHHALVLGAGVSLAEGLPDLRTLRAALWFDERPVAQTVGGNRAQNLPRLLGVLARHVLAVGLTLQPGQIVTTGTCTGLLFAAAGARVRGGVDALPAVSLQFG
jgi:2-keto-4-pentenoate hydratase